MKLQKPKGTQDILPVDSAKWQYVENVARETFKKYNYGEIRTPMFEHYEVISRSVGDTTDIVTKEMYDFHDKGDRHITLRPEGTAPVVRSYVENKLFAPEVQKPVKVYYIGSMFRYERPQAGRLREFHQLGVECFGSKNPATDVETIAMAYQLFNTLGIKDVTLHLNSLGNTDSRLAYRQALIDYLTPMRESLSKDSQRRLEENPLRVHDLRIRRDDSLGEAGGRLIEARFPARHQRDSQAPRSQCPRPHHGHNRAPRPEGHRRHRKADARDNNFYCRAAENERRRHFLLRHRADTQRR